jgi:hypothetical protein
LSWEELPEEKGPLQLGQRFLRLAQPIVHAHVPEHARGGHHLNNGNHPFDEPQSDATMAEQMANRPA